MRHHAPRLASLVLVLVTLVSLGTETARAQTWNDGAISRVRHACWQGIYDPIPEDLAWTWTGFEGSPVVGEPYRVHVAVGGLGCSGAYVLPQMKLPRGTTWIVDASHPVRCFYERTSTGVTEEITDGSCPQSLVVGPQPNNSAYPNPDGQHNEMVAFPPTTQPYWPLPPGVILTVEAWVVSSVTMSGIASNDYLLGATQILDNSPGNPTVVDDGPLASYAGGGSPSSGAWQGVFVFGAPSAAPRIAYPVPVTTAVDQTTASTRALVFNAGCLSPRQVRFNLLYPDLVTDPPGSAFAGGECTPLADGSGDECVAHWTGLMPGTTYAFQATLDPATLGSCPTPVGIDQWQLFTTAAPPGTERHAVLAHAEGPGTVALSPEGGSYPAGTSVTVTATPSPGAHLVALRVDGVSTSAPAVVVASADHDVLAVFALDDADGGSGAADAGAARPDAAIGPGSDAGVARIDGGVPGGGAAGGCHAACGARAPAPLSLTVLAIAILARTRRQRRA